MALDKDLEFSDKQSVILSSGASAVSTYVNYNSASPKDCFNVARSLEIGGSMLTLQITTALAGAGATMVCQLMTKAGANTLSSGATEIVSYTFPATSAIGTTKRIMLPPGTTRLAYLGMLYTASGGNATAGNINAYLGPPSQENDA